MDCDLKSWSQSNRYFLLRSLFIASQLISQFPNFSAFSELDLFYFGCKIGSRWRICAMASVGRFKHFDNLQPPNRSRAMTEVELTAVRRQERIEVARDFQTAGMTVHYVPVASRDGFQYRWYGNSHVLALHDLRLADGEVFTDAARVRSRKDLRGLMTFAPADCRIWGWSIVPMRGQSFTALYLDPRRMEEEVAQKLRHIPSQANVHFANSALCSTMQKMQWALSSRTAFDFMYLESLCLIAVLEVCVVQKESLVAAAKPIGKLSRAHELRVAEYIEANLGKDIGLQDMAELAGLSRFHFLRAFKKTTDETPYQYLLRRRILRARTLLRESKMTVAKIASAVGFKDSTRFIRTFRRICGMTPGMYRK